MKIRLHRSTFSSDQVTMIMLKFLVMTIIPHIIMNYSFLQYRAVAIDDSKWRRETVFRTPYKGVHLKPTIQAF